MGFAAVREEVESLSAEEQDRLAAHLAFLRVQRDPGYAREMGRRIEDRSPESWQSLDELKQRLRKDR